MTDRNFTKEDEIKMTIITALEKNRICAAVSLVESEGSNPVPALNVVIQGQFPLLRLMWGLLGDPHHIDVPIWASTRNALIKRTKAILSGPEIPEPLRSMPKFVNAYVGSPTIGR